MLKADATLQQTCPKCGRSIPINPRFITWCECGWNVEAMQVEVKDQIDALYLKWSQSEGRHIYEEISRQGVHHRKGFVTTNTFAFIVATIIHLSSMALLGYAIYWAITGWNGPVLAGITGTAFLIMMLWILRPAPYKLDASAVDLDPEQFPSITKLVHDISTYLGSPKLDGIYIHKDYHATIQRVGWMQRKYLLIGLPLLQALEPQEKVACIAHAFAYDAQYVRLQRYNQLAIQTLTRWHSIALTPVDTRWDLKVFGYVHHLIYYFAKLLSWLPYQGIRLLTYLDWKETQASQFCIDMRASEVSGTEPYINQQHKLHYEATFSYSLSHYAIHQKQMKTSFFDFYQSQLHTIPERELNRIRRVDRLDGSRLHAFCPPTVQRITLLEEGCFSYPKMTLSVDDNKQLLHELKQVEPRIEALMIKDYLASLY